jgi:hypothetical protein
MPGNSAFPKVSRRRKRSMSWLRSARNSYAVSTLRRLIGAQALVLGSVFTVAAFRVTTHRGGGAVMPTLGGQRS